MSGTAGESKILQGVRRWVQRCNDADTADTVPFVLDDSCVGCLHNSFATLLEGHGVFQVRVLNRTCAPVRGRACPA